MKKFFVLTLFTTTLILSFPTSVFAQMGALLTMEFYDSSTGEPVEYATVSIRRQGSESVYKYQLTDGRGKVVFSSVEYGAYQITCELMGYKKHQQDVKVGKPEVPLGRISLHPDASLLDGATVTAVGNAIVVKKDTLEYLASSVKTTDNDMLEDLFKKLSGFEVGSDGSITVNGETITKIMIDGKSFFLDDPQLASKNIPANIVNKIKVVEKKSEQAEFTGISDGEEETVIDISIKPGMMNNWFGNIAAGGGTDLTSMSTGGIGTDPRWQAGAMVGNFSEGKQISIILSGNNTNNRGFNDFSGGMMQEMRGARGMGRNSSWGNSNNGITTSWMGGINGNFDLLDGDMELGGNYMYGGSDKFIEEEISKTTFKTDGSKLLYNERGNSITRNDNHRFGFELDHKFSDNTSILFRPQFNFGSGYFRDTSSFDTKTDNSAVSGNPGDLTQTNAGENTTDGFSDSWQANGYLLLRQKLGKPGRTLSLSVNYNFKESTMRGTNWSSTEYFSDEATAQEDEILDQKYDQFSASQRLGGRFSYTEPLYRQNLFLEATYSYTWNRSHSVNNTYSMLGGDYATEPDPAYSSELYNEYVNQRAGLNLQWQKNKTTISLGATAQPNHTVNYTEANGVRDTTDYKVVNWAPSARVDFRPNDWTFLRLFYMGYSSQPNSTQLQPSLDISNALKLTLGNRDLNPTFNHMLRSEFRYSNKKTFFTVSSFLSGNYTQNSIINATWYDPDGVQYTIPVNSKGTYSAVARVMLNSPIAKSDFSVSSSTFVRYANSTSFVGNWDYKINASDFSYDDFLKDFNAAFASGDAFVENVTNSMTLSETLRLTYRNDKLELSLGATARFSQAWYSVNKEQNTQTWSNNVNASFTYSLPWGLTFATDAVYNYYFGYDDSFNDPSLIWNAHIDKLLFKNKFTLSLKAYDILDQSRNIYRTTTDNYVQDTRNNTLGRYLILSLTYRFGKSGAPGGRRPAPGGMPPHR